jgi:hypothetical protein
MQPASAVAGLTLSFGSSEPVLKQVLCKLFGPKAPRRILLFLSITDLCFLRFIIIIEWVGLAVVL